jgi:hypothetical protein
MTLARWPYETKRLGPHSYVTRPWRPLRDPRVQSVAWLLFTAVVVAAVWRLQAEAGLVAHKVVATLTASVLVWVGHTCIGRLKP